jgi:GxxExxY protein
MNENQIIERVIGCAIAVHKELGPGLLESSYQACLYYEMLQLEMHVEREKGLPLFYKKTSLDCGYRIDFLVESKLIVEVKAVEAMNDIHLAQVLPYLRLSNCKLGVLLNFNVLLMKNGIRRIANNL